MNNIIKRKWNQNSMVIIEDLHRQNDELAEKLYGVPVERINETTAVLKKDGAE